MKRPIEPCKLCLQDGVTTPGTWVLLLFEWNGPEPTVIEERHYCDRHHAGLAAAIRIEPDGMRESKHSLEWAAVHD